ncbi:MAG: tandem-95 repeat protein, partial [Crocosphaera sp.]
TIESIDTTETLGLVTDNGDGTFNYNPNGQFESLGVGETATDTFNYTIDDSNGGTDTANVTVTINPVNDPPVAFEDNYTLEEDATLTTDANSGVLNNDSDVDQDTLTANVVETVNHGTLTLYTDGSFDYTPTENFFGEDSFIYEVSDGTDSTEATVSLTITPVDDLPILANPIDDIIVQENDSNTVIELGDVFSDVDGDVIVKSLVSNSNENLLTATVEGNSLILDYLPEQFGVADITIQGTANEQSVTDIFKVTVEELSNQLNHITGTIHGDILTGTTGNDIITGGGGGDILTGNGGNDLYLYEDISEGGDIITDFNSGDLIDISDVLIGLGYINGDPWDDGTVEAQDYYDLGTAVILNEQPFVMLQNTPLEVANNPENFVFA